MILVLFMCIINPAVMWCLEVQKFESHSFPCRSLLLGTTILNDTYDYTINIAMYICIWLFLIDY